MKREHIWMVLWPFVTGLGIWCGHERGLFQVFLLLATLALAAAFTWSMVGHFKLPPEKRTIKGTPARRAAEEGRLK